MVSAGRSQGPTPQSCPCQPGSGAAGPGPGSSCRAGASIPGVSAHVLCSCALVFQALSWIYGVWAQLPAPHHGSQDAGTPKPTRQSRHLSAPPQSRPHCTPAHLRTSLASCLFFADPSSIWGRDLIKQNKTKLKLSAENQTKLKSHSCMGPSHPLPQLPEEQSRPGFNHQHPAFASIAPCPWQGPPLRHGTNSPPQIWPKC